MATKLENREVEVKYCDFCGGEAPHLEKCLVCNKEMCNSEGSGTHAKFSIEIYRYDDQHRLINGKICRTCCKERLPGTTQSFGEIFDVLMSGEGFPVEAVP